MVLTSSWIAGLLIEGLPFLTIATYSIGPRPAIRRLRFLNRRPPEPFSLAEKQRSLKSPNAKPTSGPSRGPKRQGGEGGGRGFYLDASARGIQWGRFGFAFGDFRLRLQPVIFCLLYTELPTNFAIEPKKPLSVSTARRRYIPD